MPEWLDWPTWLGAINLFHVAVVIVALYVVVRLLVRFWPGLKRTIALVEALGALPTFIERTDASIAMLRKQVENDHDEEPLMREEITTAREQATAANELAVKINAKLDASQTWQAEHTKESEKAYRRITALEKTIPHPSKETP
ncbi:hypothetical protein ACFWWU_36565 [Streptomyces sp. NPDC058650]|uniref:hypothetical protein n=1 Tax=Streptomyces sp. NPDC058650 TaxID=3346575 RepID=UPI00365AA348